MPRSSLEGVVNIHASSRKELQLLAKREGIRANLKTEDMRQRLLKKYPKGYPRVTRSPGSRGRSEKPEATVNQVELPQYIQTQDNNAESHELPGGILFRALEPLAPARVGIDLDRHSLPALEEEALEFRMPTKKDLRYVRRRLTELVNGKSKLHDEIEDSDRVLRRALNEAESVTRGAGELVWMRVGMEAFINREMREDRTVWDGTVFMSRQSQKKWRGWLKEDRTRREEAIPGVHVSSFFDSDPPFALLHVVSRK